MVTVPRARVNSFGVPGPRGPTGPAGSPGPGLDGADVTAYGAAGDGIANDSAAIVAAFATSASRVFFPRGTYLIDASVSLGGAGRTVTFDPGAVLKLTPSAGRVIFTADRMRIENPHIQFSAGGTNTFKALTIAGAGSELRGARFTLPADLANATLLQIDDDRVFVETPVDVDASGGYAFKYAISVGTSGGNAPQAVDVKGLRVDLGDPVTNKTYGALVYWRAVRSEIGKVACTSGERHLFPDGVIIVDGQRNVIDNPAIIANGATYGVQTLFAAEFLEIRGGHLLGRNNATWATGSRAVKCGHTAGHLKMQDTATQGWEFSVEFAGGHDSPSLAGVVMAENKYGAILVNSKISGTEWQVSGLRCDGCYTEGPELEGGGFMQPDAIVLRSGQLKGCVVEGGYWGYTNRFLKVENTMGENQLLFQGARIAGILGAFITEPGEFSEIFQGPGNAIDGTNDLATGPFAANATSYLDPSLTAITVGGGARLIFQKTFSVTANFASALTAGATFELSPFSCVGAAIGDEVTVSLSGALAAKDGVLPFAYVSSADHISLRATNTSASNHTGASGGALFVIKRYT